MRYLPRALVAGGLGFATSLIIAACGGGAGLLSANQANSLSTKLDQVSSAVAASDCGSADSASRSFADAVASLPATVSSNLRQDLSQGASTISQLAARDCRTTTTSTTTTPTTTTATTTTPATTPTNSGTTTTPSGGGGLSGIGGGGSGGGSGVPPGSDNGNGNGNGNG